MLRFALALLIFAAGCGDDPITEIVVEIDSDRTDLALVRVRASIADGPSLESTAALGDEPLPRTVTLLHTHGPLGPVDVLVTGERTSGPGIVVERQVTFVPDASVRLRVFLAEGCGPCAAPLTCGNDGRCRDPVVAECELRGDCAGDGGADAGEGGLDAEVPDANLPDAEVPDADLPDADTGVPDGDLPDGDLPDGDLPDGDLPDADLPDADASVDADIPDADASAPCALSDGICGVADRVLPGDTATLVPCATLPAGVTISYATLRPTGSTVTTSAIAFDTIGTYAIEATASSPSDCTASRSVVAAGFAPVPTAGAPAAAYRDLAARVGMAFIATDQGPFAATTAGWRDLEIGATGTVVDQDLSTVVVRGGDAVFGGTLDEAALTRAQVSSDFASIVFTAIALPTGDRSVRAGAVPPGSTSNGDTSPMSFATRAGVVTFTGALGATTSANQGTWDASEIAVGSLQPSGRGRIWVSNGTQVRNFASPSGGVAFLLGNPANAPATPVHALSIDDRFGRERLAIAAGTSIYLYELAISWSLLTAMPAPLATLADPALDLDVDKDGGFWGAGGSGVVRFTQDGTVLFRASAADTVADIVAIASAWNATTREVWVMTSSGAVYVMSAP